MKHVSAKGIAKTLERKGWVLVRVTGAPRPIPVPRHGNRTLRPGTQRSIMREAGLTDADL